MAKPIEQLAVEAANLADALAEDFPGVPVHIGAGVLAGPNMPITWHWQVVIGGESGDGTTFEEAREKAARRYSEVATAAARKAAAS